jgi:hypothetical protein
MSAFDPKQTSSSGTTCGLTQVVLAVVTKGSLLIGGRHTFELDGSRWTARYLEWRDDYVLAL